TLAGHEVRRKPCDSGHTNNMVRTIRVARRTRADARASCREPANMMKHGKRSRRVQKLRSLVVRVCGRRGIGQARPGLRVSGLGGVRSSGYFRDVNGEKKWKSPFLRTLCSLPACLVRRRYFLRYERGHEWGFCCLAFSSPLNLVCTLTPPPLSLGGNPQMRVNFGLSRR
ncbi:unnamed protein product, partial [Ascophyllum nodosum]